MRLRWSPAAEADLLAIWTYLARQSSESREDAQLWEIKQASQRLSEWPKSGRTRDELVPGMRSIVTAPYVIFTGSLVMVFRSRVFCTAGAT